MLLDGHRSSACAQPYVAVGPFSAFCGERTHTIFAVSCTVSGLYLELCPGQHVALTAGLCSRVTARLCCLQELQEQWERARAEEQSRGAGAADVRRWTGIRNIVEAREMLRTLFISACAQRAQVSWMGHNACYSCKQGQ